MCAATAAFASKCGTGTAPPVSVTALSSEDQTNRSTRASRAASDDSGGAQEVLAVAAVLAGIGEANGVVAVQFLVGKGAAAKDE